MDEDKHLLRQEAELNLGTSSWAEIALRILDRLDISERDATLSGALVEVLLASPAEPVVEADSQFGVLDFEGAQR